MRLMMGLSTLVIAAVALLWLALAPVEAPPRPTAAVASDGPTPSRPGPSERQPAPRAAETSPVTPDATAAQPEAPIAEAPPPRPPRFRLVTPRATPVPRPVQAIPTPRVIPPVDPPPAKVAVHNAVRSAKPLVAECYTQALVHSPDLAGTLRVRFTVERDAGGVGRIREAAVLDEGLRQPFLEMCVLEALGTAEYPAPEGIDGTLKVTYPFVLRPGD